MNFPVTWERPGEKQNKTQVYKRVNKQDDAQEGVPRLDAAALDSTSGVR